MERDKLSGYLVSSGPAIMKGLICSLFFILLVLSVWFSYERILFCDPAYILFRIINLDSLQIQEHRYGSFITQSVPLMGSRLELPIATIVTLYSASFNFFYLAVAALLLFVFRSKELALLMSFYYLLYVSDVFFWTNNEVHQGIAWMFLLFGAMNYLKERKASVAWILPVFLVLSFLAIYSHPLVFFPFVFLWIFFLLRDQWRLTRTELIAYSLILLLLFLSKFYFSTSDAHSHYDAERMHAATHLSFRRIFEAFVSPMAKEIFQRSLWNYWIVPLLVIAGFHSLFRQRKWVILLLAAVCMLGYFVAVAITFPNFIPFYTESEWMAFSIIACTPFVYYTLPALRTRTAIMVIAIIYLVRLTYIGFSAEKFVARREWIFSTLQTMRERNISKGLVYENDANKKILIMNWGLPAESILASALSGDEPQRTFVTGTPGDLSTRIPGDNSQMISCFESWSQELLNKKYFRIDTSAYQVVELK